MNPNTIEPASATLWAVTGIVAFLVVGVDLLWAYLHRKKETTLKEALFWTFFYISSAIAFGILLGGWKSPQASQEYFASWVTQYPLSIDNLFVFIIILTRLNVPREQQQLALFSGILLALFFRVLFLFAAIEIIQRFVWVFFLFGALLIYTAYHLAREKPGENEWQENRILTSLRNRGFSTFTVALIALGMTDLLFALDSIPATVALTDDKYIAFMSNAFAMMGLRQLYFLVEMALSRLTYLSKGLSIILAFIGIKLFVEAFHGINIDEIAGFHIPEISLTMSLTVIISTLVVTAIFSLWRGKKDEEARPKD